MNKQEIREAVEVWEERLKTFPNKNIHNEPNKQHQGLLTLLSLANLVLSIKGVERKNLTGCTCLIDHQFGDALCEVHAFNDCHDQFTALNAKRLMRVEEVIYNETGIGKIGCKQVANVIQNLWGEK